MNLNQHPVYLSFFKDRTQEFTEIYHAHQGMEFLYVHEGQGHVVVDRQIFELQPGTLFYFRPYQLHRIQLKLQPNQRYRRSLFVCEPSMVDTVLQPFPGLQAFFRTLCKDSLRQIMTFQEENDWESWILLYSRQIGASPPERRLEDELIFFGGLLQRIRHFWTEASELASAKRASATAESIMEWIEEHYTEPFELSKLAQAVHLSPNHVSSLFRKAVGSSITEYWMARRIRQACWLLRSTDQSVKAVGEAVGLTNFSYFCQTFKRHTGLTPHQFRQTRRLYDEQSGS
ncbi:AraC family transcriptional regulator [Paenibacillus aurantius]|uniref:AraC family transcriptional regulator n=1 Tax=Paenibacillus aurantius TaxID=2918900 RepID=A0AA96L9D9_9BACL|nr:AraC family transcriptional regulator [Paenibacillus aurantius]WNQ08914.1 AraC family transcriptional regulator [Paenibacillus aurantius]